MLHTTFFDVVIEIHFVFNQFDDGEQQIGVSQPAEDVFEVGKVFVLDARCDAVAEGGEYDQGDVLEAMFDAACDVEGVAVVSAGHDDDEVEGVAVEFSPGLRFLCLLGVKRGG